MQFRYFIAGVLSAVMFIATMVMVHHFAELIRDAYADQQSSRWTVTRIVP